MIANIVSFDSTKRATWVHLVGSKSIKMESVKAKTVRVKLATKVIGILECVSLKGLASVGGTKEKMWSMARIGKSNFHIITYL